MMMRLQVPGSMLQAPSNAAKPLAAKSILAPSRVATSQFENQLLNPLLVHLKITSVFMFGDNLLTGTTVDCWEGELYRRNLVYYRQDMNCYTRTVIKQRPF